MITDLVQIQRMGEKQREENKRLRSHMKQHNFVERRLKKIAEEVEDAIDCVIDDNPHKRGLFMPGSRLPIVGSSALLERGIRLCLLSLNPIGEQKVIEKNAAFVAAGGAFASIFPASERALPV